MNFPLTIKANIIYKNSAPTSMDQWSTAIYCTHVNWVAEHVLQNCIADFISKYWTVTSYKYQTNNWNIRFAVEERLLETLKQVTWTLQFLCHILSVLLNWVSILLIFIWSPSVHCKWHYDNTMRLLGSWQQLIKHAKREIKTIYV